MHVIQTQVLLCVSACSGLTHPLLGQFTEKPFSKSRPDSSDMQNWKRHPFTFCLASLGYPKRVTRGRSSMSLEEFSGKLASTGPLKVAS